MTEGIHTDGSYVENDDDAPTPPEVEEVAASSA